MTTAIAPPDPRSLERGDVFAGYRIDEVLDERGDGRVYVASRLESNHVSELAPWLPVALKVFAPDPARPPWFVDRIAETARRQAKLRHPNVVAIYETGTAPAPFLTMTLVRGPSLARLIASKRLDDLAALEIAGRVAAALEAAREHQLEYRGLRPSRVLLAGGDPRRAFLGDFGAGRPPGVDADAASSVRGLAAMLFESLAFQSPTGGSRRLRELRPDLPAELEAVLVAALDDPDGRPESLTEMMQAVGRAYPNPRARRRGVEGRGRLAWAGRAQPARAAPPENAATGSRRSPLARLVSPAALAVAALVPCAAVIGAVVAPAPAERVVTRPKALKLDSLTLRYPVDWKRAARVSVVPGVELRDAVALAPARRPRGPAGRALVVGSIDPIGPELLPQAFKERLRLAATPEAIELGVLQGYRYSGPRPSGGRAQVYVLPTTGDTIVVECLAPARSNAFIARCEQVASTLRPTGARPVALAPSPAYLRALERIVGRLDALRRPERRRLGRARTARGQAIAATRLAAACRAARRAAARLTPTGASTLHADVVEALGAAAAGYERMSSAARIPTAAGWASGGDAALAGEQKLEDALRVLRGSR